MGTGQGSSGPEDPRADTPGAVPSGDRRSALRLFLGVLLGLVALNAVAGGYYALSGAENVPLEWLEGSPFPDYTVPGIVLLVVVGGSAALAAVAVFATLRFDHLAALTAGAILMVWIGVQVSVIGSVSWLQPAMVAVAITIISLSIAIRGAGR